ncbi:hypothetical protein EVAR_75042_1 [Eumeta japonica]|uniref:Uncharacterized protein n=1 Tax=Eumeta variegata TaxID=151549 RepID=A0A4C1W3D5_EUMVA|nr:hypothetical protein EVAR_75042_1 [Eumeta japonica]
MDYLLAALRRKKQKIIKSKTTGQAIWSLIFAAVNVDLRGVFVIGKNDVVALLCTLHVPGIIVASSSVSNVPLGVYDDLTEDDEKQQVLDNGSEGSAEERMGNQAYVNEVPETSESQLDGSQVTMPQESKKPASVVTKFKHPVPIKKAKISESQKDPILSEALQLMRTSAQAATATLASTASFPAIAPDRYQIYANYLASKFRNYTASTFMAVEHQINNILFYADRGEFNWERGYQSDSKSSQASTPASAPNQNVDNFEDSQHSDDFSDLIRFNNLMSRSASVRVCAVPGSVHRVSTVKLHAFVPSVHTGLLCLYPVSAPKLHRVWPDGTCECRRRVTYAMDDAWRESSQHRMSQETVTGRFPSLLPGRRRLAAAGWSKGA